MNSVNFKTVLTCTKSLVFFLSFVIAPMVHAWEIDLSRRQVDFNRVDNESRLPASINETKSIDIIGSALDVAEPMQDIVIMNTEQGFVPDTVRLRKGASYKIHVVNVNPKQKNTSFMLDAFSEHHNTIFGQQKMFYITPKMDGIFSFQCPETAYQGRLVIAPTDSDRRPASVK